METESSPKLNLSNEESTDSSSEDSDDGVEVVEEAGGNLLTAKEDVAPQQPSKEVPPVTSLEIFSVSR